jgi:hypothetical protein
MLWLCSPGPSRHVSTWPPTEFFEAVYAAMKHFGVRVDLLEKWEDMFYLDEATKAAHVDDKHRHHQTDDDKAEYNEQKRQRRSEERNERRGIPGGFDAFDALTMVPFTAMPAEEVRNYFEGA